MSVLPNPKWELFAQGLANGQAVEKAYLAAGFKSAKGNSARLQKHPMIRQRVQEISDQKNEIDRRATELAIERLALTKEALAREFLPLATSNVKHYVRFADDGEPVVDLRQATFAQMSALRSLEVHTYMDGSGASAREVKKIKYSLWPKVEAGMAIAKLFGWVIHKTEDVSRLEERLAQMTPEQRRQDALEIFRKAKARLLEDQRSTGGGMGSAPVEIEAEPEPVEVEEDDAAQ